MRAPDTGEQVFALVFVLRVEIQLGFGTCWRAIDEFSQLPLWNGENFVVCMWTDDLFLFVFPRHVDADALGLQYELPDFVFLALFTGFNVFPAQYTAAYGTANVADNVLPGDQIARNRLVLVRVGQRRGHGVNVAGRTLHQIRPAVPTHEAFTDDLRSQAQVRGAFGALNVRAVAMEQLVLGRNDH